MLKIGDTTVKALYLGDRPIKRAYLGDKLVYEKKADSGIVKVPLPAGYTQIEYIESNSGQYIDTGLKPTSTTKIVMDVEPTVAASSTYKYFFESHYFNAVSGTTRTYVFRMAWASGVTASMGYRSSGGAIYTTIDSNKTARRMTIAMDANSKTAEVDEVSKTVGNTTFSASMNNITFFIYNTDTTTALPAKLYSCQIYSGDTITRDFVPCKNSTGTPGMFELVNSEFYPSSYSTAFIAGPAV